MESGTGIVPPDSFTLVGRGAALARRCRIELAIGGIGMLVNHEEER